MDRPVYRILFSMATVMIFAAFFSGCMDDSDIAGEPNKPLDIPAGPQEMACSYTVDTAGSIQMVTPGDCNILFDMPDGSVQEKRFSPIFGNNPSTEPVETPYFFIVREGKNVATGTDRKILINFMGGGGCWEGTNCLDHQSNINFDSIRPMVEDPSLLFTVQQGIMLDTNEDNPFRDWTLVYLPYTTGDVHWGSNDQEYTDAGGAQGGTGRSTIFLTSVKSILLPDLFVSATAGWG